MAAAEQSDIAAGAVVLFDALNSSNKDQVISILCNRTLEQCRNIVAQIKENNGTSPEQQVRSLFNGELQKIMLALVTDPIQFYTDEMNAAFNKLQKRLLNILSIFARPTYNTIAKIFCTLSNQAINDLQSAYNNNYGHTLVEDVNNNLSLHLKDILLKICEANRDETESTDMDAALEDAKHLFEEKNPYNDDYVTPFIEIFAKRSFKQLQLIIKQYKTLTNEPIENRIESLFNSEDVLVYKAIVQYSEDPYYYFARCLFEGLDTGNGTLIALVLLQCDDLIRVKSSFEINFDPLRDLIKSKGSKRYKLALNILFGET